MGSSLLGYVEVSGALARRLSPSDLAAPEAQLRTDRQQILEAPLPNEVLHHAAELARQYRLRGADAVHLAAALAMKAESAVVGEALTFVCSDQELLEAARNVGLAVADPRSMQA
jgi:predicted nucleic acid-binding protein